jgi:hypothetical protein
MIDVHIGQVFGRLTVIGTDSYIVVNHRTGKTTRAVECRCTCGSTKTVSIYILINGRTLSCGCLHRENTSARFKKHGATGTALYGVWRNMRARCSRPCQDRHLYFDKGITVCRQWEVFDEFRKWAMENGYRPGLFIDRIDGNGNYDPGNCRWATPAESAQNRDGRVLISAFGETKHLQEWAEDPRCTVSVATLDSRIRVCGWSPEKAISTPVWHGRKGAVMLTAWGETRSMKEWAEDPRCTVGYSGLQRRIKNGWPPERAISTGNRMAH